MFERRFGTQNKLGFAPMFIAWLCLFNGWGFSSDAQPAKKASIMNGWCSLSFEKKSDHGKGDSVHEIITAEDISSIIRVLDSIDEGTLVLFDCDDVLTTANIGVFTRNPSATGVLRNDFGRIISRELPSADKAKSLSMSQTVVGASPVSLVNRGMPRLVAELQEKGIACLVITAFPSTPAPGMSQPLEWRNTTLKSFDYDFPRSWPGMSYTSLEGGSVFDRGIIYSGAVSKDKSLAAFLAHVKKTPRRIIFIDDFLENIMNMQKYCKANNIDFTGIHYIEFMKAVNPIKPSIARSEFQMMVLIKHEVWLPDEILPEDKFCLDWFELCKKSIELKNINCIEGVLSKVDKKVYGSQLIAFAKKTGSKDVIQCVTQWAKS
ncbi:MAG: DUF2608 domain-containing protein [Holosporales bacterium]|nr:DUF2608 domain-containing protein [Holosporales bacterium]